MAIATWYLLAGLLLVGMALAGSTLKRLPMSASVLYLLVGFGLARAGWLDLRAHHAPIIEIAAELAVLISLFTAGLKLRAPLADPLWRVSIRLATLSMVLTVAVVSTAGYFLLDLPIGMAVLIGAILAPTDPVMASDVQVTAPRDRDRLRFGLTGEAGLNDGTAFPFVLLGLGLLGLHPLGEQGWRWLAVDVLWATSAGLAIGAILGTQVGHLVLYLRRHHQEAVGLDNFLATGLIALAYGGALMAHTYGFLAVFAAGVALRRVESRGGDQGTGKQTIEADPLENEAPAAATDQDTAPAYMARAVLLWNEQLERIAEVALVVAIGALLADATLTHAALLLVAVLILVARPMATWVGLFGSHMSGTQLHLAAWFGVRGVGSLYYATYAVNHGLRPTQANLVLDICVITIGVSVILHGVSVTPLMNLYERGKGRGRGGGGGRGRAEGAVGASERSGG